MHACIITVSFISMPSASIPKAHWFTSMCMAPKGMSSGPLAPGFALLPALLLLDLMEIDFANMTFTISSYELCIYVH